MKAIRTLLACIRRADQTFNLINHGDKIVVGLSGGKDSVVLTYCLTLYQKFSHSDFTIQPVMLDLGFPGFNPEPMKKFCESLGLTLIVSDNQDVFKILTIQQKDHSHLPCSICSRMKKAAINKVANELGYNKVAFAHHSTDAIETLVMNAIHGSRVASFSPKMFLEKSKIEFIRPLIFADEKEIERLIKEENLPVCPSHCPADKTTTREDIKVMLNGLYEKYPQAKDSFLNMLTNYEAEDLWGKEIQYQINQDGLTLRPAITPYQMSEVLYVRSEVFVKEDNISIDEELEMNKEKDAKHFLIYLKDELVGTIRYREIANREFKVERFAILKKYRHQGYGKQALSYLIDKLYAEFNPCVIWLNAMTKYAELYEKVGFEKEGELFIEANIPHIKMIYKHK